jgi:hypothetical protein
MSSSEDLALGGRRCAMSFAECHNSRREREDGSCKLHAKLRLKAMKRLSFLIKRIEAPAAAAGKHNSGAIFDEVGF